MPLPKTHPNIIFKKHIADFWLKFGGGRNDGSLFDEKEKLEALIFFNQKRVRYKRGQNLQTRREKFKKSRSRLCKMFGKRICFVCGRKPHIRHHIISLSRGGINSKRNLVRLCNNCHAKIHPWLKT